MKTYSCFMSVIPIQTDLLLKSELESDPECPKSNTRSFFYSQAVLLFTVLSLFSISSCKQAPPVKFYGQILIQDFEQIIEIRESDDSLGYIINVITGSNRFACISPDKKYLLYSKEGIDSAATFLWNLADGNINKILPYTITYASWSLDSRMFYFINIFDDLYVYKLSDNSAILVYKGRQETYAGFDDMYQGTGGRLSVEETVNGMSWLPNNKLLFQCGADFPERFENLEGDYSDGLSLPTTTTSIATIGESVTKVDCHHRCWVRGVSQDSSYILFSRHDDDYNTYVYSGDFSDNNFSTEDLIKLDSNKIKRIYTYHKKVGIIPGTSILYYLNEGKWDNWILYFVNPENLKKILRRSIGYNTIKEFYFVMDPSEKMIAYFSTEGLNIYNIETKGKLIIFKDFINYVPDQYIDTTMANNYHFQQYGTLLGWTNN